MTIVDYLLDGLEAELQLERELGVRAVEIDRALLQPVAKVAAMTPVPPRAAPKPAAVSAPSVHPSPVAPPPEASQPAEAQPVAPSGKGPYDFIFLHHRPLSPAAQEMMQKIIKYMGKTLEAAPIVCDGALPASRFVIVMGGLALAKWYPGHKGVPCHWLDDDQNHKVLVVYSPEYLLRFDPTSQGVRQMKKNMTKAFKTVLQYCNAQS